MNTRMKTMPFALAVAGLFAASQFVSNGVAAQKVDDQELPSAPIPPPTPPLPSLPQPPVLPPMPPRYTRPSTVLPPAPYRYSTPWVPAPGLPNFAESDRSSHKDGPWLGVAADEAPEVLTAQLGLDAGVGLVLTYVTTDSPAAKAGLQKNDVLVEFDGQTLVLPAQLRKLVQSRKEGSQVKLVFYRAGKKEAATATLTNAATEPELNHFSQALEEEVRKLQQQLGDVRSEQFQKKLQDQLHQSMEQAQRSYQDALRNVSNATGSLEPMRRALKEFATHSGSAFSSPSSVTVRSIGASAKSLVKSDDSGTIVLIKNPRLSLTAHDQTGKLLFDGEIETPEQRAQVPHELWIKVEPLVEKLGANIREEIDSKKTDH